MSVGSVALKMSLELHLHKSCRDWVHQHFNIDGEGACKASPSPGIMQLTVAGEEGDIFPSGVDTGTLTLLK